MPWSPAQHRLFAMKCKRPSKVKTKAGKRLAKGDACRMMKEGVKK